MEVVHEESDESAGNFSRIRVAWGSGRESVSKKRDGKRDVFVRL